jgi:hypothetical protein
MTRANAILAVLCLALGLAYGCEQRARGRAEADGARWRQELDVLAGKVRAVDTVYRADTVRLWRTVRDLDTLTVTVQSWKHDTVRVVEYVQRADSAVRACVATVLTCETRVALRDSTIRVLRRQWEDRPKPPSPVWRWAERLGIAWVGYKVGQGAP